MLCCTECFLDDFLKKYIDSHGIQGSCDFCGQEDVMCIDPEDLQNLFLPVINLYTRVDEFMPMELLKEMDNGQFMQEYLTYEWEVFDSVDKATKLLKTIFPSGYNHDEEPIIYLDSLYRREDVYWGKENEYSDGLIILWDVFCREIKFSNRFFPKKTIEIEILKDLLQFTKKEIPEKSEFFRARIADRKGRNILFWDADQMGKPPAIETI